MKNNNGYLINNKQNIKKIGDDQHSEEKVKEDKSSTRQGCLTLACVPVEGLSDDMTLSQNLKRMGMNGATFWRKIIAGRENSRSKDNEAGTCKMIIQVHQLSIKIKLNCCL